MKFREKHPPREFEVGYDRKSIIKDCGTMQLAPNEQITFVTEADNEYDVTRRDWGFYAAPSLNGRLAEFHLRAVLVKNKADRFFLMLVEKGKEDLFQEYVDSEPLTIVYWMDSLERLQALEQSMTKG